MKIKSHPANANSRAGHDAVFKPEGICPHLRLRYDPERQTGQCLECDEFLSKEDYEFRNAPSGFNPLRPRSSR